MNRLIILASITMMLYGKTQCCISTYDVNDFTGIKEQYNCSTNIQFTDAAKSVTSAGQYIEILIISRY